MKKKPITLQQDRLEQIESAREMAHMIIQAQLDRIKNAQAIVVDQR